MKVIVGAEQLRQIVIPLDCVIDLLTDADVAAAGGRNRLAVDAAKFIWQLRVNLKWIPGEIYNHKDTSKKKEEAEQNKTSALYTHIHCISDST